MIAFDFGIVMFGLGSAWAVAAARTGDVRHLHRARFAGLSAVAWNAFYLVMVGVRAHRFPVANAFEAFVCLAAIVTAAGLALDFLRKWTILVVATLPLSLVTSLLALALYFAPRGASVPRGAASLWTSVHIVGALASYGAFAIAFVCGILYIVAQRQLKGHGDSSILGLMPSLESVARINVRAMALGVAFLVAGLVVGYLHARNVLAGEQGWRVAPKIILTTVTVVAYGAVLALSGRPGFKGRRTALASVLGFLLVMATFWTDHSF